MRLQAAGWRSLLLSTLLCTGALAKKDKPAVKSKKFDFLPQRVQYFDDSDVILLEDPVDRAVWRSANAGEDWDKVPDVPAGTIRGVSMHPYDPHRAYIITTETTHWKTDDRGETWVEFSTESTASIGTQNPMVYHAGDPNKIIFNAMDCSRLFCEEIVSWRPYLGGVLLILESIGYVHHRRICDQRKAPSTGHCGLPLGEVIGPLCNGPGGPR